MIAREKNKKKTNVIHYKRANSDIQNVLTGSEFGYSQSNYLTKNLITIKENILNL